MKKVTIYTTPTCTYCKMAKGFFNDHKVLYEEFDVASDMVKRQEMIEKSKQMGVPVIFVEGDDTPIIGFDKERLVSALEITE